MESPEQSQRQKGKKCSTCGLKFEPSISFCPADGTRLEEDPDAFSGELIKIHSTGTSQRLRPHVTEPPKNAEVGEVSYNRPQTEPMTDDTTRQVTIQQQLSAAQGADNARTMVTGQHTPRPMITDFALEDLIGSTVDDQYEILEVIGKGGMSVVYKARQSLLNRTVAIKMMLPHLMLQAQSLMRFQQEARAASNLRHKNVIYIHGFGAMNGKQPYLVMDYVEGESLADLIQREHHLEPARAINLFIQIADAFDHAHSKGIVHRDLKPSNILLVANKDADGIAEDFVYIVDFGIAKVLHQNEGEGLSLTQTGEVFGSPLYMSPEQCRGEKLDHRADIYSFGVLMYETLTGRTPITGESTMDVLLKHTTEVPPPMSDQRVKVPTAIETIVLKCLVKDRQHRYQSMEKILCDLKLVPLHGDENLVTRTMRKLEIRFLKRRTSSNREAMLFAASSLSPIFLLVLLVSFFAYSWRDTDTQAQMTELLFEGDSKTLPQPVPEPLPCKERESFDSMQERITQGDLQKHQSLVQMADAAVETGCSLTAAKMYDHAANLSMRVNGPVAVPTILDWLKAGDNYARMKHNSEALIAYGKLTRALDAEQDSYDEAKFESVMGTILYQQRQSADALRSYKQAKKHFAAVHDNERTHHIFVPPKTKAELMKSDDLAVVYAHMGACMRRLNGERLEVEQPAFSKEDVANSFRAAYDIWHQQKPGSKNEFVALANYLAIAPDLNDPLFLRYPDLVEAIKSYDGFKSPEYATILVQYAHYLWKIGHYWEAIQQHVHGSTVFSQHS